MKFTSGKLEAEGGIDFRPPPSSTADWIEANYRLPATNLIDAGPVDAVDRVAAGPLQRL